VVLFSTVAVGQGMPMHCSVAAAKGAVEGLVRTLAAEWAPKIRSAPSPPENARSGYSLGPRHPSPCSTRHRPVP